MVITFIAMSIAPQLSLAHHPDFYAPFLWASDSPDCAGTHSGAGGVLSARLIFVIAR